jgi:hypothetical protein
MPYTVRIKQTGTNWRVVYESHSYLICVHYAKTNIVHGNNVERIEIHDLDGCVDTIYDKTWENI